jgi:nucleotide sugar dehydrogenase
MENNITVIGLGKLGLGFALLLADSGYNILGVDIFPDYIEHLNTKTFHSYEPGYNEILQKSTNFRATTDLKKGLDHSDIIFILVQTPNSGGDRFYDHSILSNLLETINGLRPSRKDLIIGCTVMPGYIDDIGKHLISDCPDSFLSYNPEFVAQGDIVRGFRNPDIILLGTTHKALTIKIKNIYEKMCATRPEFCFMTPLEAEITKISLNGFLTTKLSFANMIYDLCTTMGADHEKVLNAIGNDSRIGNKYFRGGYSFGGPCFPRDTKALKQIMDQHDIFSDLLKGTTDFNEWHRLYQVDRLLGTAAEQYIFEDVAFKENCTLPLIEESAKLKIAQILVKRGKTVVIRDHEAIVRAVRKEYGNLFQYEIK